MAKLPTSTGFHAGISEPSLTTTTSTQQKNIAESRFQSMLQGTWSSSHRRPPTTKPKETNRNRPLRPHIGSHCPNCFGSGEKIPQVGTRFCWMYIFDVFMILVCFC